MTQRADFEIVDASLLTDADWTEINKLKRAYEIGEAKAVPKALYELYIDSERAIRVLGAFYPDIVREAIRDAKNF
jgi:hypothetical protein